MIVKQNENDNRNSKIFISVWRLILKYLIAAINFGLLADFRVNLSRKLRKYFCSY